MRLCSGNDRLLRTPAMSNTRPTVFIVDDDISVRESLEALSDISGWQPQSFASAEAFLASAPVAGPCCLVLDVTLPDLSGLDLQDQLGGRREMPIIFITGFGDVPMSVRAMKRGAADFVPKPFADDALLEAVADALERSRTAL